MPSYSGLLATHQATESGDRPVIAIRRGSLRAGLLVGAWLTVGLEAVETAIDVPFGRAINPWLLAVTAVICATIVAVERTRGSRERQKLTILLAALILWPVASLSLTWLFPRPRGFPDLGEVLGVASYFLIVAFLLVDGWRRSERTVSVACQSIVVLGGTACATGLLVMGPVATAAHIRDISFFVALVYPMLDVVMGATLALQVFSGDRILGRRTTLLFLAVSFLLVGDLLFLVFEDHYVSDGWVTVAWAIGVTLLTQGATESRYVLAHRPARRPLTALLLIASAMAIAVLAVPRPTALNVLLILPAVATLVTSALLLVMMQREARRSALAYGRSRTDPLTGLPTRRSLVNAIPEVDRASSLTLIIVELADLREIAHVFGPEVADEVVSIASVRMVADMPTKSNIAHVGSGSFAIAVDRLTPSKARAAAESLVASLRVPYSIKDLNIVITSHAGIAANEDGVSVETLVRRAELAADLASSRGELVHISEGSLEVDRRAVVLRAHHLRRAVDGHKLDVWYQPQVRASDGRIKGVEALVRWNDDGKWVAPPEFLSLGTRMGLMDEITMQVTETVLRDLPVLLGGSTLDTVSLNLAAPELAGPAYCDYFLRRLREVRVDARRIILEVTEQSIIENPAATHETLSRLRSEGIAVSIDDFGTAYSSLSQLRILEPNELKFDREFTLRAHQDNSAGTIIRHVTAMAHQLGLGVVAEGAETLEQVERMRELGVDVIQGFRIARPMPLGQVVRWLPTWRGWAKP
jgi:diguanylate cyclase